MSELRWMASVGCEGGPVIVASHETFVQWPGGRPLALEQRSSLHIWGQFTGELPEKFHPAGPTGHQFIAASGKALLDLRDELLSTIRESWPDAKVSSSDEGHGQILRKDHKQLWFNLAPLSEYERCWQEAEEREAWHHCWGDGHTALFWEVEGGGMVDIGVAANRSELVLLRTWVDDEQGEEAARAHVMANGVTEQAALPPFESGEVVVVCWAQADSAEIEGVAALNEVGDSAPSLGIPGIGGVCTAQRIAPGTYNVTYGAHEDDGWSSRWCRLKLSS